MTELAGGAPPQVIRRADGSFHILNVELGSLSETQRVALAAAVWPQIETLLTAAGEYRRRDPKNPLAPGIGTTDLIDQMAAQAAGVVGWSAVNKTRPRLLQNEQVAAAALNGEFDSVHDLMRGLGMTLKTTLVEGKQSRAKLKHSQFSRGDKFMYAIEPILQYSRGWKKKEYRFPHVNPKEAQRRLKKIEEAMEHLAKIKEDLEPRSHAATLSTPSEKRRR